LFFVAVAKALGKLEPLDKLAVGISKSKRSRVKESLVDCALLTFFTGEEALDATNESSNSSD
jgi:hypothetical protein